MSRFQCQPDPTLSTISRLHWHTLVGTSHCLSGSMERQSIIDFTIEEGERITKVLFGDRAGEVLRGRWQAVK